MNLCIKIICFLWIPPGIRENSDRGRKTRTLRVHVASFCLECTYYNRSRKRGFVDYYNYYTYCVCVCVSIRNVVGKDSLSYDSFRNAKRLVKYLRTYFGWVFSSAGEHGFETVVTRLRSSAPRDDNRPIDLWDIAPNIVGNLHMSVIVQGVSVCFLSSFCLYQRSNIFDSKYQKI